ncbi:MAG TPA: lipocalin-like domain-containing protein [Desulfomonilaceae bacterium]|nr:lipocalin-like domain-containing protein [Desulfomonilaceae bacterium]
MVRVICALALVLLVACPCFGQQPLVGTWKVVSFETEYQGTGAKEPVLGNNPVGYTIFTSDGQVASLITAEGLKAPLPGIRIARS